MTESKEDSSGQTRRSSDAMIARIDERTENLSKQLDDITHEVKAVMQRMSDEIQKAAAVAAAAVKTHEDKDAATYVTKDEFSPVKMITFSLVASACIAVLAAVVALVVHTPGGNHFEVTAQPGAHIAVDPYHFPVGDKRSGSHK